mmetsp:Transcript_59546/g.166288  ORF Transcript_59546/g.166288 Transcript_59546/m.166288 type:complete len:134 (-) Transcript_59546:79-480(-)
MSLLRVSVFILAIAVGLSVKTVNPAVRGAHVRNGHGTVLAAQPYGKPPPVNEPDRLPLDSKSLPEQGYDGTGPNVGHVDGETMTSDWHSEIPKPGEKEAIKKAAEKAKSNAGRSMLGVPVTVGVLAVLMPHLM